MKWLLITNNGNPGDIWVRLGVQGIIRRLDPEPVFNMRERDFREGDPYGGLTEPDGGLVSDYVVVCGMPLLWSHKESDGTISSTTQHASWQALNTWLSPRDRMIIAGFGIYLLCPDGVSQATLADPTVPAQIQPLFDRCRLVYSRSSLAQKFFPSTDSLHCPSLLATRRASKRDLKLCNFMPGGSHYPNLAPAAAALMEQKMPILARHLIAAGFEFVAHRQAEETLALRLGWPKDRIYCWHWDGSGDALLELYGRCSKYLGNRIHGGIMARAVGADVVVIGYDTRLLDVQDMGGQAYTPSTLPDLISWIESEPRFVPYDLEQMRQAHLNRWSAKLKLPIRG